VALGDPVGPQPEWSDLVWRFIELADSHGAKAAFYQIPPSSLPLYLDAGLEVLKLGEMASIFLPSFTLEGSARADLRYAVKRVAMKGGDRKALLLLPGTPDQPIIRDVRGERDGLRFEMIPPDRVVRAARTIAAQLDHGEYGFFSKAGSATAATARSHNQDPKPTSTTVEYFTAASPP